MVFCRIRNKISSLRQFARLYDEKPKSYESDAAYKQRILADLKRSKQVLEKN